MEPELYINLVFFYWHANRAFAMSERTMERCTEANLPVALDNVYAELQSQSNETGAFAVVFTVFPDITDQDEKERLKGLFPPKIILPINKVLRMT